MTEGRKAGCASKIEPDPLLSSKSGSATENRMVKSRISVNNSSSSQVKENPLVTDHEECNFLNSRFTENKIIHLPIYSHALYVGLTPADLKLCWADNFFDVRERQKPYSKLFNNARD